MTTKRNRKQKIRILDTFAWVGGFHLALEQSVGKENVECVGYSEIDKWAKQVYNERFPWTKDLGSITDLDIDNLDDFDLLTGWFPCQDVSVAWKQNLEGGRTVLVEYLLEILEKKQPSYFVFENVKGLMGKKFDGFRESIIERMQKAWYNVNMEVLNTKNFGLPQNRERVFMVWKLHWKESFEFPQWQPLTTFLKDVLEKEVDEKYYKEKISSFDVKKLDRNIRLNSFSSFNQDNIFCWMNDVIPTLTRGDGGNRPKIYNRLLTPTECCRLQWFPDNWNEEVSNFQRYKQMWNAISVPVVKAILDNLMK